jgi:hypothetical protein
MRSVLLALAAVICMSGPAWAQRALVTADRASVRERATASSAVLATVARDTELDVIATEGVWVRVRIRATGVEGYLPASFVRIAAETSSSTPESSPAAPPGTSPAAPPTQPAASPSKPAGAGAGATSTSTRTFLARAFGGLWNGGRAGLEAGGGVAMLPFSNPALEISADGSYIRVGGTNAYSGSVDATFNFVLPSERYTPFAGGGLTVVHQPGVTVDLNPYGLGELEIGGATNVALQLLGGVDLPFSDRRAFRGELRIRFLPTGTTVSALAGLSF